MLQVHLLKKSLETTILHYVKTLMSAYLIYVVAEAWNDAQASILQ
jgi:hypothetical protein